MHNMYSIVVHSKIMRLLERSPMSGMIGKGEYKYYYYYNHCHNCSVLITVTEMDSRSDIDLFVNHGKSKSLPSKKEFDIAS